MPSRCNFECVTRDLIRPFGAPSPMEKGDVKLHPSPLEKVAQRAG